MLLVLIIFSDNTSADISAGSYASTINADSRYGNELLIWSNLMVDLTGSYINRSAMRKVVTQYFKVHPIITHVEIMDKTRDLI